MSNNQIYNKKTMAFSTDTTRAPQRSKKDILQEILEHPPVSMRTHREDLIIFNGNAEEPRLIWRQEMLSMMDESQLRTLLTFIEKQTETRTKQY
jgi:hypothetical protein